MTSIGGNVSREEGKMISSWTCSAIFIITVTTMSTVLGSSIEATKENSPINIDFRLVPREEWHALPPEKPLKKLTMPVKYVFISHTVTDFCYTKSVCTKKIKNMQTYHMESNHWSDIAYNFLLGGDGLAYVGRDWDFEGAHTFHYNNISIGVSFIGNFDDVMPTKNQLEAAKKLLELGVELGKISEDYILLGQRQVAQTLSPGDALYHIIKTWPHWSSVISKPGEPIRPDVPATSAVTKV